MLNGRKHQRLDILHFFHKNNENFRHIRQLRFKTTFCITKKHPDDSIIGSGDNSYASVSRRGE